MQRVTLNLVLSEVTPNNTISRIWLRCWFPSPARERTGAESSRY